MSAGDFYRTQMETGSIPVMAAGLQFAPKAATVPQNANERTLPGARIARIGQWLCVGGAAVGALGLLGWITGTTFLTTIVPGQPRMMPNTALALLLIGGAAAARPQDDVGATRKTLSALAALLVLFVGIGALATHARGIDLHIDHLLAGSPAGHLSRRPSPLTALALSFLGAALLFDIRTSARVHPSGWLVLCAAVTAFVGLMGLVFGAAPLYPLTRAPLIGVSLPTVVSLLLISIGLLLERPTAGIVRLATSSGPGSIQLRRLGAGAVVVPVLLGLVVKRLAVAQGIEDISIPIAILSSTIVVVGLLMLSVAAVPLNRIHQHLEASRAQTRNLIEQAPDGIFIADPSGRYTDVNDAGCRMLGCVREDILGKTIEDLLPPEDIERLWQSRMALLAGATHVAEWRLRRKDASYVPVEVSARILPDGRWQGVVRDISERKRLEEQAARALEQLRESEDRLRRAIDDAPIGTALVAPDGRFVRVNRALAAIVGYSIDELMGMSFQDITHPDDLNADLALADQLSRGEIPQYQHEKRSIRKDGVTVDVMLSRSIVRGSAGEPRYYITQVEDITDRKRLENELRLSEAKSTGILSISADAIISIDSEQHITLFNEGAEKIFGYSKSEVIGAPLDILIPERLRVVHRQHVMTFAAAPGVARKMVRPNTPVVGLRKGGQEFPADAAISKLEVGGTPVLTVVLRDVTEQKRIENEQRFLAEIGLALATTLDYDETLSRIAEIAARDLSDFCIVSLVDDKGQVDRLRVVSRDPAYAWIGEALQRVPLDQQHVQLVRSAVESKQPVLLHPSPEDIDAAAQNDDERRALRAIRLQSVMVIPLIAHGRVLGAISFLSMPPARAFRPEDLPVAQELAQRAALAVDNARLYRAAQRAIQERDDVLGIVAHDLRNPLATILMQAGLLQRRAPAPESGFRESAETIKLAASRMNHLIEDLLDVARVEAGRLTIERSRLRAGQVASDAFAIQKVRASSAGLELRLDLPEELPEVWADRDRLLQVFDNLIGNAIKFTAPGGFITVGAASRDDHVLFWVGDMGPGIAVEDQSHLFDRFWQARSARRGGAGLGLSIVRGIVGAHGGSVWVESAPGQGSTFVFTIPIALDIDETPAEPALRSIAVRRLPRTRWPLQRSTCRSLVADGRIRKR